MGVFVIFRAILVRAMFACHGLISIWRLYYVTREGKTWFMLLTLMALMVEAVFTIWKKKGQEWKWFCPSVFLFLLTVVPVIWKLELHELNKRIMFKSNINATRALSNSFNESAEDLSARIEGLGFELKLPVKLSSDQWVKSLEQALLLFLILGRWILPKGKLTHDQLSQLLLVYIGTAADIVEFFEAFKEDVVSTNHALCTAILGIWSWSLMQFTMVLTATKGRKDHTRVLNERFSQGDDDNTCCTPDVYGIIISIMMQDCPFLILRMMLIFKFGVLSYTNMFFTCKNSLVIALLLYRLVMVQLERRDMAKERNASSQDLASMSQSSTSSRLRLISNSVSSVGFINKVHNKKYERRREPEEVKVDYVIKRHISFDDIGRAYEGGTGKTNLTMSEHTLNLLDSDTCNGGRSVPNVSIPYQPRYEALDDVTHEYDSVV